MIKIVRLSLHASVVKTNKCESKELEWQYVYYASAFARYQRQEIVQNALCGDSDYKGRYVLMFLQLQKADVATVYFERVLSFQNTHLLFAFIFFV